MDGSQRLDRGDPLFRGEFFILRNRLQNIVIAGVAAGGDDGDPLRTRLGIEQGGQNRLLDGLVILGATQLSFQVAAEDRQQLSLANRLIHLVDHLRQQNGGAWRPELAENVISRLLQFGRGEMVHDLSQQQHDLVAMHPPGQSQILRQCRCRLIAGARGDECLVAVDRKERRQRHAGIASGSFQFKLTVERAVEETHEEAALALVNRQAECLQIPAVLTVPRSGQLLEGVANLVGRQVANRQDQLTTHARVRVVGQGEQLVEMHQCRCGHSGLGLRVLDLAVFAAVAAEHSNRLFADLRVGVFKGRFRGRIADDRGQNKQSPRPHDWLASCKKLPQALNRLRSALDQCAPGRVLGCNRRRLERRDQTCEGRKVGFHFPGLAGLGSDPENPSGRLVAEGVAANPGVVPVGNDDRAIRCRAGVHRPEPWVIAGEEDLVFSAKCRALASQREEVDLPRAGIHLEQAAKVFLRQQISFVDQNPRRAAVTRTDELGHVARHVFSPVPGAAGCVVAVMTAVHRPDHAAAAVAIVIVVTCEDVAKRVQAGLVVVSLAVADDLELGPVTVGAHRVGKLVG